MREDRTDDGEAHNTASILDFIEFTSCQTLVFKLSFNTVSERASIDDVSAESDGEAVAKC